MEEKKEILEKLYDDFLKEKEIIQSKIDECKNKISEASSYINSITDMEDSDFKFFSPRDVESIYKESLKENRNIKEKYEEECQKQLAKKEKIDIRLKRIEYLMLNCSSDDLQSFEIQEKERQRIARDLHDSSLQNLTHIVHKVELASLYMDKDVIQAKLELADISKNLKDVIEEIRNTIFDLRPMQFDDFGLKESIEQLAEKMKRENSMDIICNIDDISLNDKNVLMSLFRIVQECMNNAVKHSKGNSVEINIKNKDDCFDISISDNGEGFNVDDVLNEKAKKHFGLMILEERVNILHGTINIDSELEKGTKVHIQFPLQYLE